jgi:N-methylhydantoinase B/oxoprolinase/acetone carboxylase alpha subunit
MLREKHGLLLTVRGCTAIVAEASDSSNLLQNLDTVGTVHAKDYMDDGTPIALSVTIDRNDGSAVFDFEGTGPQVLGNTNAPTAVTFSAVIYALRCLVQSDIPLNGGCLAPVTIKVLISEAVESTRANLKVTHAVGVCSWHVHVMCRCQRAVC